MPRKKLTHYLSKVEKIAVALLAVVIILTGFDVGRAFYMENSDITPVNGGQYVEGAVGRVDYLNPLLVQQGSVAHDLTQLIFSGLTRYDTKTGDIIGDLADFNVSGDGKEYTFVIRNKARWHDGEPVTADDVIFTYNSVIKAPGFKGAVLTYNDYAGIKVSKIDERTVQFLLEKPDSFFLVKTTVGILPEHVLRNDPVEFMDGSPFNFSPIGSGRYRFVSQVNLGDHIEYNLEAFAEHHTVPPHIESILFKVFESYSSLEKRLSEMDAVRSVPKSEVDKFEKKDRWGLMSYELPQYVALFFNSESPKLKSSNVRLALQLGTDKDTLIKSIGESKRIDTPLLEISQSDWTQLYSVTKANGALFESEWQIPNKEDMEVVEEEEEVNDTGTAEVTYINSPNEGKDWETTQNTVTITGTVPKNTKEIAINDYALQKYVPGDSGWSYVAKEEYDNLKPGKNVFEIYATDFGGERKLIDAITIVYGTEETLIEAEKEKLEKENDKAAELPIRQNKAGEKMSLNLITSQNPPAYGEIAQQIKEQWLKLGVDVHVEVLEGQEFQSRLSKREYDLLIFGQNLGYNLDAYPYWHSSQAKEGGLNLSQFKNFIADSLLETARIQGNESRKETLADLQEIMSKEVPAVFLYSPTYYIAFGEKVQNVTLGQLATTTDHLSLAGSWYARVDRRFKKGTSPITLALWLAKQF